MKGAEAILGTLVSAPLELLRDLTRLNENQWKWLLKERLGTVNSMAALVKWFRDYQPRLLKLETHINSTDNLIDQIVYRLYGLTAEEIAIVEGTA